MAEGGAPTNRERFQTLRGLATALHGRTGMRHVIMAGVGVALKLVQALCGRIDRTSLRQRFRRDDA